MSERRRFSLRRRKRRRPRQLKTTREGKLLIAITLGLGFGAINSGNNLLYLILGMLLSLIVVSGVLSELTLRGIRVRRTSTGSPHAGKDAFFSFEIHNEKRRRGSFSVEIEEIVESPEPGLQQRPAYSLFLRPGESQEVAAKLQFKSRGVFTSRGLRVATRFPFSFFRKSREVDSEQGIVVYPALVNVEAPRLHAFSSGAYETFQRIGRGGEYHGLREHRIEDDPRDIHWKSSARMGRLVSREYESTADRRVWLLVPNAIAGANERKTDKEPTASVPHAAVELAISHTASLAAHYGSSGWAVGVRSLDGVVPPATGEAHLTAIFEHLARLQVHEVDPPGNLDVPGAKVGERILVRHPEQGSLSLRGAWDHEYDFPGAAAARHEELS